MQNYISILFLSLLCFQAMAYQATPVQEQKIMFENVDITPLVKFYGAQVKILKKQVAIYNWAAAGNHDFWKESREASAPEYIENARTQALSFWDEYASQRGKQYMYGVGLYGAADPVSTFSYGGGTIGGWILMELVMPVGLRIIDVTDRGSNLLVSSKETLESISSKFKCSSELTTDSFFRNGGGDLDPLCQKLANKIFDVELKVDAFAYSYGASNFKACVGYEGYRAFVVTRNNWINASNTKIFTAKTVGDYESRRLIQTLFLTELQDRVQLNTLALDKLEHYLVKNQASAIYGSSTKCEAKTCVITVRMCDLKNQCENIELDPIPRPGGPLITAEQASSSMAQRLLWADLEGKPKTTTVSTWLKQNKLSCDGQSPYVDKTPAPKTGN